MAMSGYRLPSRRGCQEVAEMRSALIIIDMLNDFVDGVLANAAAKEIIDPISSLAERVRASDEWVVVYANDDHELNDVELRVFPPHAMAGTPGDVAEIQDQPARARGDKESITNRRSREASAASRSLSSLITTQGPEGLIAAPSGMPSHT
jgi:nicotinamidase-related amidase